MSCFLLPLVGDAGAAAGGGTQLWSTSFDAGTPAFSYDVAVSPDGSKVFATGTTNYGTSAPGHFATVAVDAASGAQLWAAVYRSGTSTGQRDQANRIAVSPDGSKVFVTGASWCSSGCGGGSTLDGYSTVAYDASNGARLWTASYAEAGPPGAFSIAVTPDGSKVFVNGQSATGTTTVAYDSSTGSQLFAIQGSGSFIAWEALAVSPDSSVVYVASTGQAPAPCGDDVTAYAAADGTQLWTAHYSICGLEGHLALVLSPDGSTVFAVGSGSGGFTTFALDAATGTQLWATPDPNVRVDGDGQPTIAVSPDGSKVFTLGYACASRCAGDQPFVTTGYDTSTGEVIWESRYDSGGTNYPADLAVSADGSQVYATGQEQMPCHSPCTATRINAPVVAYDATTGVEAWVGDYQDNNAWALAISPTGTTVYAAGTFTTAASATVPHAAHVLAAASKTSCSPSACGYSMAAYNSQAGPGIAQDRDTAIRLNGWRTFFDSTALGGAYRASRSKGQAVTFKTPRTRTIVWVTHRGPQQGKARVFIDGHSKGTFDLYAPDPSRRSVTFSNLPRSGHRMTVKVLGAKDAASRGRWVAIDAITVGGNIRSESALGMRYGSWTGRPSRVASGGSYRESGSSRARASLDFTGRAITWVTATGPAFGRARVVIDGRAHTIDLYRPRHHWRVKITFTGLPSGTHLISVRPLGTKNAAATSRNVDVDAFIVH